MHKTVLKSMHVFWEPKNFPADCSIRVPRLLRINLHINFLESHDQKIFFQLITFCTKLGQSGPSNNFSNRYGLTISKTVTISTFRWIHSPHWFFPPLGEWAVLLQLCIIKRIASLISVKREQPYNLVMSWLGVPLVSPYWDLL